MVRCQIHDRRNPCSRCAKVQQMVRDANTAGPHGRTLHVLPLNAVEEAEWEWPTRMGAL